MIRIILRIHSDNMIKHFPVSDLDPAVFHFMNLDVFCGQFPDDFVEGFGIDGDRAFFLNLGRIKPFKSRLEIGCDQVDPVGSGSHQQVFGNRQIALSAGQPLDLGQHLDDVILVDR